MILEFSSPKLSLGMALAAAVLINFSLFRWVSIQDARNIESAVESVLRNEYSTASTYQLSRSLVDLERLHILSCVHLWELGPSKRLYYDTATEPSCSLPLGLERLLLRSTVLKAANGLLYELRFQIPLRVQTVFLELLGYALALVSALLMKRSLEKKELENKAKEQLAYQAIQFAHDIRSPLAALEVVSQSNQNLPEEERSLVQSAATNIRDIANDLLAQGSGKNPGGSKDCDASAQIHKLLEGVIAEKRIQFRDANSVSFELTCSAQAERALVKINSLELRRIVSNLLNNSVEAMQEGVVSVHLGLSNEQELRISIKDSGVGMSAETLSKLGTRGFSLKSKAGFSGSGIGVHYAIACIERAGGRLEVESELGKGSAFHLLLPYKASPAETLLNANENASAVLLDNDPSMGAVWNFAAKRKGVVLRSFTNAEDLRSALSTIDSSTPIFLDQNLGEGQVTGVDLAREFYDAGYKDITLTTGESSLPYSSLPWIKKVIGKTPPWIQA